MTEQTAAAGSTGGATTQGTATTAATATTTGATTTATATQPAAFDWKATLGDGYGQHEKLLAAKGWKGPGDVLSGYGELEKLVGADKIALPGKDAKPEDWNPVWSKLGRPDKPEGYQFTKPEGFDGYTDEFAGIYRDAAHKANLTGAQAAAMHDWFVGQALEQHKAAEAAQAKAQADLDATLTKEWGADKAKNTELARRGLERLGASQEALASVEKAAGYSAAGMKLLHGFAAAVLQEDRLEGKGGGLSTPADAKAEMARLQADPDFSKAWMDRSHVGHAEAVRRMAELGARANPQATTEAQR